MKKAEKYHGWITMKSTTGRVAGASKMSSTDVYGSVGGRNNPGYVSSDTTIQDDIFLVDCDGEEHSVQLYDLNVASREGHIVSAIWTTKKRKAKVGHYSIAYNHTTDRRFVNIGYLKKSFEFFPGILSKSIVSFVVFLATAKLLAFAAIDAGLDVQFVPPAFSEDFLITAIILFFSFLLVHIFLWRIVGELIPRTLARIYLRSPGFKEFERSLETEAKNIT